LELSNYIFDSEFSYLQVKFELQLIVNFSLS
jgi:hypothetical protein